jgi:glycosyltransferase involved in cell wall biosynthesis
VRTLAAQGFGRLAMWSRGVDAPHLTPAHRSHARRAAVAGDQTRPILLYVGRLSPEKNLIALVTAFRALLTDADAHLVLVGDGPARAELQRALAGLPVTFTGYLRGDALAVAYASADVFAFPSRTETYGQVIAEAMASALPVVAFDSEGARDLVVSGETGLLLAPDDRRGFAQALHQLARSAALRQRLGAAGRSNAMQRPWSTTLDALLSFYEAASSRGAAA